MPIYIRVVQINLEHVKASSYLLAASMLKTRLVWNIPWEIGRGKGT